MAADFDRQVANAKDCAAILNQLTRLRTPMTMALTMSIISDVVEGIRTPLIYATKPTQIRTGC
jgi:hypothetical protein